MGGHSGKYMYKQLYRVVLQGKRVLSPLLTKTNETILMELLLF